MGFTSGSLHSCDGFNQVLTWDMVIQSHSCEAPATVGPGSTELEVEDFVVSLGGVSGRSRFVADCLPRGN